MTDPRYQEITKPSIPAIRFGKADVKVICGHFGGVTGPADAIAGKPEYLDVELPEHGTFQCDMPPERNAFAYIYQGTALIDGDGKVGEKKGVLFDEGDTITISSGDLPVGFLLISGVPLSEPIAWSGPIVMNYDAELKEAFTEFHEGRFLKVKG